jgi:hypothetical protein
MRHGGSLGDAASHFRMSQERLRAYLKETTVATREKGRWKIIDHRLRQFPLYSNGTVVSPWMSVEQTSEAARYMQAVKLFLHSGEASLPQAVRRKRRPRRQRPALPVRAR